MAMSDSFAGKEYRGAPLALNEEERLRTLETYQILDTEDEQPYDDLVHLAATVCGAPIAMVTLVDRYRQWFKSKIGITNREDPRELSFCAHAILRPGEILKVPNALEDPRFADNPLVTGAPAIRFYAGVPLITREGAAIGTICVIDRKPSTLSAAQERALHGLARQVVAQLELRQTVAELETQSMTDPLTGVWNRRAFQIRLREEWARHTRAGEELALLMIDIDHFKSINDRFGHPEGDATLKRVAHLLGQNLRINDHLVRYGGEEFSLLLSGRDIKEALIAAERARLAVSLAEWSKMPITVSIGISTAVPASGEDPNLLIARADHALYEAKRRGRNRAEVFQAWNETESSNGSVSPN
jgi:diguanylate cyclase (GGDEF)-like protein